MRNIILVLVLSVLFYSCEMHHENEWVVKELVENPDKISEIMDSTDITRYYRDSVLKGTSPQDLWRKEFKTFGSYEVQNYGYWFDRRYFERVKDVDGNEVQVVSLIRKSDPNDVLEFNFKYINDSLVLTQINYRSHFDTK